MTVGKILAAFVAALCLVHSGRAQEPINQWIKVSPLPGKPSPGIGWEGSADFDPISKKWIHYGGHDGIPQGFHTFTFDPKTGAWEQRFPPMSPAGVCCVDGGNTFDAANRCFVRFPGGTLGHGYQWSRGVKLKASHVWLYDPAANSWTNMRPAPYRAFWPAEGLGMLNPAATYDPNHELALSFGGQATSGGTNNLFAYDAYANRLHRLPATNPPSPRDGMGLAYDAKNDCVVVFGSQYASDEKTWIYRYETGKWEGHDLNPHPVGKKIGTYSTIPRMAYDPLHGVTLCVTWDSNTNEHETWAFDAGQMKWTKMSPSAEAGPSMSRSRNLGFSAGENRFLMSTTPKGGKGHEVWAYRYAADPKDVRPAAPTDPVVETAKDKATLTWKSATPAKEYHVYRAQADEPWKTRFEKVATVNGTSFEDKTLAPGKVTYYTVKAVDADGVESLPSVRARTEPRVLLKPVASVLSPNKVEVTWNAHPAKDIVGYNIYRGNVVMNMVKKGELKPWRNNDPEYAEPLPVEVKSIDEIRKLNAEPITNASFTDNDVSLIAKDAGKDESKFQVSAYIVKALNKLGVESGPSPYVLTIPSTPTNVLCREKGDTAELKWDANPEKGIAGYHVYKLGKGHWEIVRASDALVKGTTYSDKSGRGSGRYWIVPVDSLGQEGEPSSPAWFHQSYKGFYAGEWHQ